MKRLADMYEAPLSERLDLVRYKTAEMHFAYAAAALKLAKRISEFKDVIFFRETVWTAFFVNYAKPFRQSRNRNPGLGLRLTDELVPNEYRDAHNSIIKMRDKHFAHTDLDLQTNPFDANSENLLIAIVTKAGLSFGIFSLVPSDDVIREYDELLDVVMEKVSYRANKIIARWGKHVRVPPGMWTINLSDSSNEVLYRAHRKTSDKLWP